MINELRHGDIEHNNNLPSYLTNGSLGIDTKSCIRYFTIYIAPCIFLYRYIHVEI